MCVFFTPSRLTLAWRAGLRTLDLNHTPGSGVVCADTSPHGDDFLLRLATPGGWEKLPGDASPTPKPSPGTWRHDVC